MLSNGRSIFAGVGIALFVATSATAGDSDPQEFTQIERGRYLAVLSDCASCHTVPGRNQPFAGGRAIETPFGNIVAPNIAPDIETGIGSWSDDAFDAAIRKGLRRNGSRLYPAMPYTAIYENVARRCVGDPRLPQHGDASPQRRRREYPAFSVQHPHIDAGVERV